MRIFGLLALGLGIAACSGNGSPSLERNRNVDPAELATARRIQSYPDGSYDLELIATDVQIRYEFIGAQVTGGNPDASDPSLGILDPKDGSFRFRVTPNRDPATGRPLAVEILVRRTIAYADISGYLITDQAIILLTLGGLDSGIRDVADIRDVEAAFPIPSPFARAVQQTGATDPSRITVAGSNGWIVYDLETGEAVNTDGVQPSPFGTTYGATPIRKGEVQAVFPFGSWGAHVRTLDNETGRFGPEQPIDNGNITDAYSRGDDSDSGELIFVDNSRDRLNFLAFDEGQNKFVVTRTLESDRWPSATGKVVSAFWRADGTVLFVTDGVPGQLWLLADAEGSANAVLIGEPGDFPRRVRCCGDIVAVSSYGTGVGFGSLSTYARQGNSYIATVGLSGGRPIGIDLRKTPDGNIAIAFTSFLTHIARVLVVTPAGEADSDQVIELDEGCRKPGHALWLDDGAGTLLVTCNETDSIAVIGTGQ